MFNILFRAHGIIYGIKSKVRIRDIQIIDGP